MYCKIVNCEAEIVSRTVLNAIRKKFITRLDTTVMMETSVALPTIYLLFVGGGGKESVW